MARFKTISTFAVVVSLVMLFVPSAEAQRGGHGGIGMGSGFSGRGMGGFHGGFSGRSAGGFHGGYGGSTTHGGFHWGSGGGHGYYG